MLMLFIKKRVLLIWRKEKIYTFLSTKILSIVKLVYLETIQIRIDIYLSSGIRKGIFSDLNDCL